MTLWCPESRLAMEMAREMARNSHSFQMVYLTNTRKSKTISILS
jgi:hypothetical protein